MTDLDLEGLIREPRETLDIEIKDWLDLTNNDHRSHLAKEIIALANHGGGYVIIGLQELSDGNYQPSFDRPNDLKAWSLSEIQAIIAKYIDPAIQCGVVHQPGETGD